MNVKYQNNKASVQELYFIKQFPSAMDDYKENIRDDYDDDEYFVESKNFDTGKLIELFITILSDMYL